MLGDRHTIQDIGEEIIANGKDIEFDGPEYELVAVINVDEGPNEERFPIREIRWDHNAKQLLLIQN